MKRKLAVLVMVISLLMTMPVFAATITWEDAPGHHNQSVLLPETETSASDSINGYARGTLLSTSTTEITNEQDGTLYIEISTYANRYVDKIYHTVFLDRWDADKNDWVLVDYWEFEKNKSEVTGGKLSSFSSSFTVSGCQVNKYYRVRGLHAVEYNGSIESASTETNGVKLTKN